MSLKWVKGKTPDVIQVTNMDAWRQRIDVNSITCNTVNDIERI